MSSTTLKVDCSELPIKSVTVFKSDKAEVVREFSLELKKGQNVIEIFNLARTIDTQSARVSGIGGAARLNDVACTFKLNKVTNDKTQELISQKEKIIAQKDILLQENSFLNHYGESLTGQYVSVDKITDFLQTFRQYRQKNSEAIFVLSQRISELDKDISKHQMEYRRKERSTATVTVVLNAEDDAPTTLRLTYLVSSATWEPVYDLHASTADNAKSITLSYRALVTQRSGEDWKDSTLTLSTAAAQRNDIPELGNHKIRQSKLFPAPRTDHFAPFTQPPTTFSGPGAQLFGAAAGNSAFGSPQRQSDVPPTGLFGQLRSSGGGLFGTVTSQTPPPPPPPPPMMVAPPPPPAQPTVAFASAVQHNDDNSSEFEVVLDTEKTPLTEEPTVIRTSSLSASFVVQVFDAKVTRVAVPRLRAEVYLQCNVENTSQYRLLAGSINIFLDEGYVSKTSIPDTAPGDAFDCTLGVDPSITVVYEKSSKTKKDTPRAIFGDVGKSTTTFTTTITLTNKHTTSISGLIVKEVLPLPDPEDDQTLVKVLLKKPQGLADIEEGDSLDISEKGGSKRKVRWSQAVGNKGGEKEGKFEWVVNIKEGEEAVLVSEYDVKVPTGIQWHEIVTHPK
ncbi:Conserved hypothetical protein CHP02231 [Abortiporus biennis]